MADRNQQNRSTTNRERDSQQYGMQGQSQQGDPGMQPYGFSRQGVLYDSWGQPTGVYYEEWAVSGPFTGYGPEGYQRGDDRIKEDVCDRLMQHGNLDARNITVDVKNGEVILQGSVDSRRAKRMAEDTAESVSGVQDVRNELRVQPNMQQGQGMNQPQGGTMGQGVNPSQGTTAGPFTNQSQSGGTTTRKR